MHGRLPRHLLYVDDVLIFLEVTRVNGRCIRQLLDDYGNVFGQKFSPPKSMVIYSDTTSIRFKIYIKRCTSITTGSLPLTHLGVPIFKGHRRWSIYHLLLIRLFIGFQGGISFRS